MWSSILRQLRSERGQTLVEFVFTVPIIVVFLLALVDFGLALDRREVLEHAVREGARQAAIGADGAATAQDQSGGLLQVSDIAVCYVDGPDSQNPGMPGSFVRVSGDYTYHFGLFGDALTILGGSLDPSITMNATAQETMETADTGATACS